MNTLSVTSYDYMLPEKLVARYPLQSRSDSKLMYVSKALHNLDLDDFNLDDTNTNNQIHDKQFTELVDLLNEGDLIVFNDTKVMKARLFGQKDTGGKVELLVERLTDNDEYAQGNINVALCHVRASKSPKIGQKLFLADSNVICTVIGRHENLFIISFESPILINLEKYGELPIPPYFERHADEIDNERYQTVFHNPEKIASVAAPTASLHFDDKVLKNIADKGINKAFVTLHVGAGTFAPVKTDNILEHIMHSEYAILPQATADLINETQARGNKVIAVGTTVTRVLETAYKKTVIECIDNNAILSAWSGDTDIFIYPGFEFGVIDRLLTNFHLPKSTLLMLVSAFAGKNKVMSAYKHAIEKNYRFFSYGDSMLLDKQ